MSNEINLKHKAEKVSEDVLYATDWNDNHEGVIEPKDIDHTVEPELPKKGDVWYDPETKHIYIWVEND